VASTSTPLWTRDILAGARHLGGGDLGRLARARTGNPAENQTVQLVAAMEARDWARQASETEAFANAAHSLLRALVGGSSGWLVGEVWVPAAPSEARSAATLSERDAKSAVYEASVTPDVAEERPLQSTFGTEQQHRPPDASESLSSSREDPRHGAGLVSLGAKKPSAIRHRAPMQVPRSIGGMDVSPHHEALGGASWRVTAFHAATRLIVRPKQSSLAEEVGAPPHESQEASPPQESHERPPSLFSSPAAPELESDEEDDSTSPGWSERIVVDTALVNRHASAHTLALQLCHQVASTRAVAVASDMHTTDDALLSSLRFPLSSAMAVPVIVTLDTMGEAVVTDVTAVVVLFSNEAGQLDKKQGVLGPTVSAVWALSAVCSRYACELRTGLGAPLCTDYRELVTTLHPHTTETKQDLTSLDPFDESFGGSSNSLAGRAHTAAPPPAAKPLQLPTSQPQQLSPMAVLTHAFTTWSAFSLTALGASTAYCVLFTPGSAPGKPQPLLIASVSHQGVADAPGWATVASKATETVSPHISQKWSRGSNPEAYDGSLAAVPVICMDTSKKESIPSTAWGVGSMVFAFSNKHLQPPGGVPGAFSATVFHSCQALLSLTSLAISGPVQPLVNSQSEVSSFRTPVKLIPSQLVNAWVAFSTLAGSVVSPTECARMGSLSPILATAQRASVLGDVWNPAPSGNPLEFGMTFSQGHATGTDGFPAAVSIGHSMMFSAGSFPGLVGSVPHFYDQEVPLAGISSTSGGYSGFSELNLAGPQSRAHNLSSGLLVPEDDVSAVARSLASLASGGSRDHLDQAATAMEPSGRGFRAFDAPDTSPIPGGFQPLGQAGWSSSVMTGGASTTDWATPQTGRTPPQAPPAPTTASPATRPAKRPRSGSSVPSRSRSRGRDSVKTAVATSGGLGRRTDRVGWGDEVESRTRPVPIHSASTSASGRKRVKSDPGTAIPLRKGKWFPEEAEYVTLVKDTFEEGLLPLPEGVTLRALLSMQLHCSPMRITKKFPGDTSLGKKMYRRNPDGLSPSRWKELSDERLQRIAQLRVKLQEKLSKSSSPFFLDDVVELGVGSNEYMEHLAPPEAYAGVSLGKPLNLPLGFQRVVWSQAAGEGDDVDNDDDDDDDDDPLETEEAPPPNPPPVAPRPSELHSPRTAAASALSSMGAGYGTPTVGYPSAPATAPPPQQWMVGMVPAHGMANHAPDWRGVTMAGSYPAGMELMVAGPPMMGVGSTGSMGDMVMMEHMFHHGSHGSMHHLRGGASPHLHQPRFDGQLRGPPPASSVPAQHITLEPPSTFGVLLTGHSRGAIRGQNTSPLERQGSFMSDDTNV
jgi:hypothetical protein